MKLLFLCLFLADFSNCSDVLGAVTLSPSAAQDRKARYLGCALAGNLPTVSAHASATAPATPSSEKSGATAVTAATISPASSLKQQHQHFRISDYHFDVFLDHVRRALAGEDPEAADLAPAQLEALRPNVVLDSRAACPVSGATSSSGRGCPFRRPMVEGAPLQSHSYGS
eukprot:Skav206218  [mRNA]  locus=scaffold1844:552374:553252:- [translate_table: standard]